MVNIPPSSLGASIRGDPRFRSVSTNHSPPPSRVTIVQPSRAIPREIERRNRLSPETESCPSNIQTSVYACASVYLSECVRVRARVRVRVRLWLQWLRIPTNSIRSSDEKYPSLIPENV